MVLPWLLVGVSDVVSLTTACWAFSPVGNRDVLAERVGAWQLVAMLAVLLLVVAAEWPDHALNDAHVSALFDGK